LELQHSFTVPADLDKAWATLLDLEGVAPCFPGATLTGVDGEEFTGQVKVKLGPVSLLYTGRGRFVERDDATHRAVIEAHGSDKRGNGTAGATMIARLEAEGEGTTRVVVATQLKVTGRPAQFGRGVMQDVGGRIVDQFATALARQLAGEPAPETRLDEPVPETRPAAPRTAPVAPTPARTASERAIGDTGRAGGGHELDLNSVVLPVLARRYGSTLIAVVITAAFTWLVARRRFRR
jgi:carbon monoxide dehydrogenase subunit G